MRQSSSLSRSWRPCQAAAGCRPHMPRCLRCAWPSCSAATRRHCSSSAASSWRRGVWRGATETAEAAEAEAAAAAAAAAAARLSMRTRTLTPMRTRTWACLLSVTAAAGEEAEAEAELAITASSRPARSIARWRLRSADGTRPAAAAAAAAAARVRGAARWRRRGRRCSSWCCACSEPTRQVPPLRLCATSRCPSPTSAACRLQRVVASPAPASMCSTGSTLPATRCRSAPRAWASPPPPRRHRRRCRSSSRTCRRARPWRDHAPRSATWMRLAVVAAAAVVA